MKESELMIQVQSGVDAPPCPPPSAHGILCSFYMKEVFVVDITHARRCVCVCVCVCERPTSLAVLSRVAIRTGTVVFVWSGVTAGAAIETGLPRGTGVQI